MSKTGSLVAACTSSCLYVVKIVAVQAATKQLQVFLPPKVLLVRSCKAHYKDTPFGLGRVSPTAKNPTPPVTKRGVGLAAGGRPLAIKNLPKTCRRLVEGLLVSSA